MINRTRKRAIWLKSAFADPPGPVMAAAEDGHITIVPQRDLSRATLFEHGGMVTSMQLDQDHLLAFTDDLRDWLGAGARWLFNGHMVRPILTEMVPFQPIPRPGRADFVQTRLSDHPLLDGIDAELLEANRGVAGFYGRGHNPLPPGARPITGLGQAQVPVDWHWPWQGGGAVFSHAGNDLWGAGLEHGLGPRLVMRAVDWARGVLPCG